MKQENNSSCTLCWWGGAFLAAITTLGVIGLVVYNRSALAELFCYTAYSCEYVDEWHRKLGHRDVEAETRVVRDFLLAMGAAVGVFMAVMAIWRNHTLTKQNKAAIDNAKAAARNADIANARLLSDQFVAAAELMAKDTQKGAAAISARIDGINILKDLAFHEEKWPKFAPRIIRSLMAYIKDNAQREEKKEGEVRPLGEDVKTAFAVLDEILKKHGEELKKKELLADNDLSFEGQDFSHLNLSENSISNWRHYSWDGAKFVGATLLYADLMGVSFRKADMRRANFGGASLQDANFENARLQGADFIMPENIGRNATGEFLAQTPMQRVIFEGANMEGACLMYTNLENAKFSNADLSGVQFFMANIKNAEFFGRDGRGTIFSATNFRGARTNQETHFPPVLRLQSNIWRNEDNGSPMLLQPCKFEKEHFTEKSVENLQGVWEQKDGTLVNVLSNAGEDWHGFVGILKNFVLSNGLAIPQSSHEAFVQAAKKLYEKKEWPKDIPSRELKSLKEAVGILLEK